MERKWYMYRTMVQLNGEEECAVCYSNTYYYLSEKEKEKLTKIRRFYDFEYAKVCAQDSMAHYMVYKPKTWYRKKEKICFRLAEWWDDYEGHQWLTKEEFESYLIYDKFIPLSESYSLEEIMKHSSADDFIKYMKDKGMTTCPMIK